MKNNIQISKYLKDDIKNQEDNKELNILDFMYKYFNLYVNTKKASNIAKNSLISINFILEKFFTFISDELAENTSLNINNVTKYFLNDYLLTLADKLSKSSQKLHFTIIKNFLFFIADHDITKYGFIKININGMKIKTEQKEKESFTQNEQILILKHIDKLDATNSFLAQRNSLIIKILLFAGLRISELINIKWSDVTEFNDETHGILYSILITGKGNKERYAYLQYKLITSNLKWLKIHSTNNNYIFTSTHGNQCNASMLFVVINNALAKAGASHRGLHIFRHTFARNLVDKDINLATIKDLLGHSNISVTAQFYAKSNENAKRNALFKK